MGKDKKRWSVLVRRGWRWTRRGVHRLLGLVINRYTASLLLLLVCCDVWCEFRGIPAFLERRIRTSLEDAENPVEFSWIQAGIVRGIVFHDVKVRAVTPAGPAVAYLRTVRVNPDWLELLQGRLMLQVGELSGGQLACMDASGKPSVRVADLTVESQLSSDGFLSGKIRCAVQGVLVDVDVHLEGAREGLRAMLEEERPDSGLQVDPELQALVSRISKFVSESIPRGGGSLVRLNLTGDFSHPEGWRYEGFVNVQGLQFQGLEVRRGSFILYGDRDCLCVSNVRVSLGGSDHLQGQVSWYPLSQELSGEIEGELNGMTAVRLYEAFHPEDRLSLKTRMALAWMLRLPVSVSCTLARSPLRPEAMDLQFKSRVAGAELPYLGRCSGQVEVSLRQGMFTVEEASISLDSDNEERLSLTGRYALKTGATSLSLTGAVLLNDRLRAADLRLPESMVTISDTPCRLELSVSADRGDWSDCAVSGSITQEHLRLLGIACRQARIPFAFSSGTVSLRGIEARLENGRDLLLKGDVSCDVLQILKQGLCRISLSEVELGGSRSDGSQWGMALNCSGTVAWRPLTSRLSLDLSGSAFPDRLYQNYLRHWNVDSSGMLKQIDCGGGKDPLRFTLKVPEFSLEHDDWRVQGDFNFGQVSFNGLAFERAGCEHFEVTPAGSTFQGLRACTAKQDELNLDLQVDHQTGALVFSRAKLVGAPQIIASFFLSSGLRDVYLSIFKDIRWSGDRKATLRLPRLVFLNNDQSSVSCEGLHIHAQDMVYRGLHLDDFNAIVSLDLPHSVTLETISLKKDNWWLGGRVELALEGVKQCRFQLYDTLYGIDLKFLLNGLAPALAEELKPLDISHDCVVSCEGSFFLEGDPQIRLGGGLRAQQVRFGKHELEDVRLSWSYNAGNISWQVRDAAYLGGNLKTSGVYDLAHDHGKVLLRVSEVPLESIHRQFSLALASKQAASAGRYKGHVSGELQVEVLHGWAGRDWHLNGNGHVSIREAELWNMPVLSTLSNLFMSATFGWLSGGLGQISNLDADLMLSGANITVPLLKTDGTIISLRGKGGYHWTDDWRKGELQFLVSGIPVQDVKILSLMLSSLTGMFQAELTGTLEENHWKMRTFIDMLF